MEGETDTRLRVEALQTAARLSMSANLPQFEVVKRAEEFYAFLAGKSAPTDVTAQSYRLVPESDNPRSADTF